MLVNLRVSRWLVSCQLLDSRPCNGQRTTDNGLGKRQWTARANIRHCPRKKYSWKYFVAGWYIFGYQWSRAAGKNENHGKVHMHLPHLHSKMSRSLALIFAGVILAMICAISVRSDEAPAGGDATPTAAVDRIVGMIGAGRIDDA